MQSGTSVTQEQNTPSTPLTPIAKRHARQALKPVHVHEAIRRLEQSHLSTPMTLLWVG